MEVSESYDALDEYACGMAKLNDRKHKKRVKPLYALFMGSIYPKGMAGVKAENPS